MSVRAGDGSLFARAEAAPGSPAEVDERRWHSALDQVCVRKCVCVWLCVRACMRVCDSVKGAYDRAAVWEVNRVRCTQRTETRGGRKWEETLTRADAWTESRTREGGSVRRQRADEPQLTPLSGAREDASVWEQQTVSVSCH